MVQEEKLEEYCKSKLLDFEIEDGILTLNDKEYEIIDSTIEVFDEDLEVVVDMKYELEDIVFFFGGRWYIQNINEEVNFKELKYIGKAVQKIPSSSFLGIHSGYELMNGLGLFSDYVNKGVFLGMTALGICEKNTLSGVLAFQEACLSKKIKPITGMSVSIKGIDNYEVKLYVKNFQGWLDLLEINTLLNVEMKYSITMEELARLKTDLYVVADPKVMNFREDKSLIDFFQLDTVQFSNTDLDSEYLDNLEQWILSDIKPISIVDSYYLEPEDFQTREVLWAVGKAFDLRTTNQFMKNRDEYAKELISMFSNGNRSWISLFKEAVENERILVENCNFIYDTNTRHLPKYIMTEEEAKIHKTNDDLFIHLIKVGFAEKNIVDKERYVDRLKVEIEVLKFADVIDYFLSLYDIIKFSREKNMLTGLARGSAAGSLVAYLLGIIKIDPLEFDLLFERFLNVGRAGNYEDRPLYIFTMDDGTRLELPDGTLVRINRNGRETADLVDKLKEGDIILRY